ncbi:uncharacterized protein LOC121441476 isoform X1 [Microtus oregoni]|uniref:uncharacterized protein LOC121441476 isoform X1 n=1 Tax=Microtus oregoni TaxID=111838 RepID=UPI001BB26B8A|nr:uncharacterized protein LOC121441476 isoform X1 [Microtus oregoni]
MKQDHNPQNSMSLSERKTSLSVRSQEERDGNGSLKPAPASVGGFSQGCGGHGQGFAPVTEALGWFLAPDSDCKWRTDAAQLQHPVSEPTGISSCAVPGARLQKNRRHRESCRVQPFLLSSRLEACDGKTSPAHHPWQELGPRWLSNLLD